MNHFWQGNGLKTLSSFSRRWLPAHMAGTQRIMDPSNALIM